jgi:hypothetical protein
MNIIIEPQNLDEYKEKYTVLELDTIRILPENRLVTAYCVVEQIPLEEMQNVEDQQQLHANLLENYKKRDWQASSEIIEQLTGCWDGELDSFYEEIRGRIAKYIDCDPGELFDGIIEKTARS